MRTLHTMHTFPQTLVLLCLAALLSNPPAVACQEEGLRWGGSLSSDLRLGVGDDFSFADSVFSRKELRLDLHMDANPGKRVHLYAETWLRAWGFPEAVSKLSQLASIDTLVPLGIELREAYVDIYGFLFDFMDLRVGKQRIVWGTAEKISIIDNLDPYDLEDPWDFGRHLASDALKLTCYWDALTLQAVYIPVFRPARIAEGSPLLDGFPSDYDVHLSFALPGRDPSENAVLGLRASIRALGWDISLSYILGRDDLPVAARAVGQLGMPPRIDVDLDYLREHIVGLDVAGELLGFGIWGELAFFIPEAVTLLTDMSAFPGMAREELETQWYLKGVAGMDYTFSNGIYVNLQYARGFPFEHSRNELGNYFLFGFEWRVFNNFVKIGPIGFAFEADDFGRLSDTWAFVLNPELSFYPVDNAEITLGVRWIEGERGTTLGLEKDSNELYIKGKFSF